MEQANKKYFVSYFYNTAKNEGGLGNVIVGEAPKINNGDKIEKLTNYIKNSCKYKDVVILNFQEL